MTNRTLLWCFVAMACVGTEPAPQATVVDVDGDGFAADVDCDDTDARLLGPAVWLPDEDGDGVGEADGAVWGCRPGAEWVDDPTDDCDDADPTVGAAQIHYADLDGDGFSGSRFGIFTCVSPEGHSPHTGDCDDEEPSVFPGAVELCDGVDNDCDGLLDQGEVCGAWIPLGFQVRDVDFDRVNERLVVVPEETPEKVVLIDIVDGSTTEIALPGPVDTVSVAPDGRGAVVSQREESRVLWIELDTQELPVNWRFSVYTDLWDVRALLGELVLLRNGSDLFVINVFEGTLEQQLSQTVLALVIDAERRVMYGNTSSSSSSLHRFDLSVVDVQWGGSRSGLGSEGLWISNGGSQLYGRDGVVHRASSDSALDMTYLTTLSLPHGDVFGVAGSEAHERVFALHRDGVFAFDTAWMEPLGEVSFPREVQREHTVDSVTLQHGFVADTAGRLVLLGESRYESVLWSQELSAMP